MVQTVKAHNVKVLNSTWFDTLHVQCDVDQVLKRAVERGINFRRYDSTSVTLSLDETTTVEHVLRAASILCQADITTVPEADSSVGLPPDLLRSDQFMSQTCFHQFQSETEMMRYLRRLADKDIALDRAMIPLGSCTMKLNAASEMAPVSWPEFSRIHPFAPDEQTQGYRKMIQQLEQMLCACTGYEAISLQPNAGSQGEYAGLLAIRRYHHSRGDSTRSVCLIPSSAHGTNPASAQMAGMQVVVVACDDSGNIDLQDLDAKLAQYGSELGWRSSLYRWG